MPSDPAAEPRYRPPPALYPFPSRWCDVAGHRLHYLDEGPVDTGPTQARAHGPVLLFLHGNPSWSFLYRDLIRQLRGRRRCVAPDLPGLGLSATPPRPLRPAEHAAVVAEFLDALGLHDLVLVGHDWGGPIGLAALERNLGALAQQPALLCWGGRDPFIGAAERRHFERLFPHHDTLVLPAAGHFVPEDAPQAMAGAIASAVALW